MKRVLCSVVVSGSMLPISCSPSLPARSGKKTRRDEILGPRPYLVELATLSEVMDLYPIRHLAERGTQIAFEFDHQSR